MIHFTFDLQTQMASATCRDSWVSYNQPQLPSRAKQLLDIITTDAYVSPPSEDLNIVNVCFSEGFDDVFPIFVAAVQGQRLYVLWRRVKQARPYEHSSWDLRQHIRASGIRDALDQASDLMKVVEPRDWRVAEYKPRLRAGLEFPE